MQHAATPLAAALERIGDRWSLLVVDALLSGPLRFNDLAAAVGGIAPNILSRRLKQLEADGVLRGALYQRRPPRAVYELTAAGRELAGALRMLASWGAAHTGQAPPLTHDTCGTPVEARWYCPTCAALLGDDDTDTLQRF
jgi:DNA-binding HxlR family transcriptional regulator